MPDTIQVVSLAISALAILISLCVLMSGRGPHA